MLHILFSLVPPKRQFIIFIYFNYMQRLNVYLREKNIYEQLDKFPYNYVALRVLFYTLPLRRQAVFLSCSRFIQPYLLYILLCTKIIDDEKLDPSVSYAALHIYSFYSLKRQSSYLAY